MKYALALSTVDEDGGSHVFLQRWAVTGEPLCVFSTEEEALANTPVGHKTIRGVVTHRTAIPCEGEA